MITGKDDPIKSVKIIRLPLFVFLLLTSNSCDRATPSNAIDKEQIISEIRQMFSDYHSDIHEKGLMAEFKYLDQSSDFFWVPPGYNSTLSYDSVRSILEINSKLHELTEFYWDTLQIFPLTKEIASYSGIVSGRMIDTAGVETKVSIIESGTVIKRDNGWKLLSGQSAVINNLAEIRDSTGF